MLSRSTPLALLLLCAACAGTRERQSAIAPDRLVVVAASSVRLPPQTAIGHVAGGEDLAEALARETADLLRAGGFGVPAARVSPQEVQSAREGASELAGSHGAGAALVLLITRLDVSALRTQGRAEVDVSAELISAAGRPLWAASRTVHTSVKLYRAQADWRSHLRQVAAELVRDLP